MKQNTTSFNYGEIERVLRDATNHAKGRADDDVLVAVIHPRVEQYIRDEHGIEDAILRGIGGIKNVMITESVNGFAVVICDNNL